MKTAPVARERALMVFAAVFLAAGFAGASLSPVGPIVKPLTGILMACAIAAELTATRYAGRLTLSGAFLATMLAVGFLGPASAFTIPLVSYLASWIVERYRWQALLINIAGSATFAMFAALILDASGVERKGIGFVAVLAALSIATMGLNLLFAPTAFAILDDRPILSTLKGAASTFPAVLLNVSLVAVIAGIYAELGLLALLFVLLNLVGFAYMARLVVVARDRTRQYANLSWGVLSSLIRTLNERDSRASRHCAAVAAFSRDLAKQMGRSEAEQELAHTAGLLHDIGKFALSDRVMERGGLLDETDWRSIRRHPEIGADLLQDIGVYGPVAEIVKAHHERVDGRGYPDGLTGGQIPELAKIVAVAEVYDTLTAPDTYRTPMNSFEALNELRRVSGSQLDPACVEAMAELLAGRGVDYRHADEADFDAELDIERRMNEAVAPTN